MMTRLLRTFLLTAAALAVASGAHAQLRVVTYNTATGQANGVQTARSGADVVLGAIGEESIGGIARPVDVLLLQEQFSNATATQSFVDILNDLYGAGTYTRLTRDGSTSTSDGEGGAPSIVYNMTTVSIQGFTAFGDVGGASDEQPRSTLYYKLRPVGYDASADFHVYNSHYKAGDSSTDLARRLVEAESIRSNADALGEGESIIYAGDFNMDASSESAFQELLSSGAGQAFDPINQLGTWHNNSSFARWHTQSPCENACTSGFAGGGIDDRFDFQLVSGELLDNEGMSYLAGSYHTFGNNGSTYNDAVNVGNTITFPSVTSYTTSEILNALESASDHLPVVADYQLPAILSAEEGFSLETPLTFVAGEAVALPYVVTNAAPVDVAIGADELDFLLSASGDLTGGGSGSVLATTAGQSVSITLDTSTPGMKSGVVTVASTSPGDPVGLIELNLSWEVVAAGLAGDFNDDGVVDAADYTVWRDTLNESVASPGDGADGDYSGVVDAADYALWVENFGASDADPIAAPEPAAAVLFAMAALAGTNLRRRS